MNLNYYLYSWSILVFITFILLIKNRKNIILFDKNYFNFLFIKWKIIIFILAISLVVGVGLLGLDPTWDLGISIIMSVLTYYTSPYSAGIIYRFFLKIEKNFMNLFYSFVLTFFSASWFYDGYNYLFLLGEYPATWSANIFYSIPVYLLGGMVWNLNYDEKKGMYFSFSDKKWINSKQNYNNKKFLIFIIPAGAILTGTFGYLIYLLK